jgi:hypothetical protein
MRFHSNFNQEPLYRQTAKKVFFNNQSDKFSFKNY